MIKIKNLRIRTDLMYKPEELFWVHLNDNIARIGMSPLVQETTGTFVAIQFGKTGTFLSKGDSFGSIEAEKHVGHLKAPLSGKIARVNEKVVENPRLINTDPYGYGWLVEIEMSRREELTELIQGEEKVASWFESEIKKYDEKGWLAQP